MHPEAAARRLSAQVADVQALQLRLGHVLEQRRSVLALALLHPVAVHSECATIDNLKLIYM